MQLAVFHDNGFVAQFYRHWPLKLNLLCLGLSSRIIGQLRFGQFCATELREHFRKVLYLWRRQPDTTVRGKGAQLGGRLAAMNQRWSADGNLNWTERIQFAAGGNRLAGIDVFHFRDPGFIWRCPAWIKDNHACLA